jgi:large subunit ribosomal protein L32
MAVPKGKMSRSRTRHRRSHWTAKPTTLIPVTVGGLQYLVPRRLVRAVQRGYIDPTTNNS